MGNDEGALGALAGRFGYGAEREVACFISLSLDIVMQDRSKILFFDRSCVTIKPLVAGAPLVILMLEEK